ncbi:Hypothetical predicted protein [Lecanosticta acicola]|uniref:NADP-dependent oxidoreductase domain-containing protein n=1 Tax=Lecanosticta acicola TaxID=111012 RepID=A0AAI8YXT3_9PEZI|nr:Hypothetical predicted protein [Lecanosticta acicola]
MTPLNNTTNPAPPPPQGPPKVMSHVNLMTDTVIANLPPVALRSILRALLSAADPSVTASFEARTREYLMSKKTTSSFSASRGETEKEEDAAAAAGIVRATVGCGMCWEAVEILAGDGGGGVVLRGGIGDGDVVQGITAVQKSLVTTTGKKGTGEERERLQRLLQALETHDGGGGGLERSIASLRALLGLASPPTMQDAAGLQPCITCTVPPLSTRIETFALGSRVLPRLFSGLWQLSSPSWGTSTTASIQSQFQTYAAQGFTAYDMADHYGDAEILFGKFRSSCSDPEATFGATKYCVFVPTEITRELVAANVTERCSRMGSNHVDLLQFHWQNYEDTTYLDALRYLQEDSRVRMLALCNFDTQRMEGIVQAGIKIHTNQVQFSLIDSRPISKMGAACKKHDIKLLTYGTLCGGFLADKWLGRPEPELFLESITPSQRKYYEMIVNWGGWQLFQELLQALRDIATKHHVAISNVATRWVLDFPYVGAVIVGTRMGVSGHAEGNLATYGWTLDEQDQAAIEHVLSKSRRDKMIELLGDCGGEYR